MSHDTNVKKLENGRAEFAYKCVKQAQNPNNNYKTGLAGEYKSYVKKTPALIQTNGLGNTLAYIVSKGNANKPKDKKNAWDLIYEQLADRLKTGSGGTASLPSDRDLLEFTISRPSTEYRQITAEILALLNWLKRLADGLIEGGEEENV
jgi:CRISPR-associated protein Cmr5